MPSWQVGDEVQHARFGRGKIVRVLHRGLEVLVNFQNQFLFRVDHRTLERVTNGQTGAAAPQAEAAPATSAAAAPSPAQLADPQKPKPSPRPTAAKIRNKRENGPASSSLKASVGERTDRQPDVSGPELDALAALPAGESLPRVFARPGAPVGAKQALSVLDAFRLGIVPRHAIDRWTFGRSVELAQLKSWLSEHAEGTMIMEGAYGSGKTHLLEYMAHQAANDGYATAVIRLDPGQGNAAFPLRLYREVIRNLLIPLKGHWTDLRETLQYLAPKLEQLPRLLTHPILGPAFQAIISDQMDDEDWAALGGEMAEGRHFSFHLDFTTVSNVVCNLLSCIAQVLVRLLDLNGLLILMDEVETAQTYIYRYYWDRALNLLRGLTLTSNDDPVLAEEDVVRDPAGFRVGRQSGLVYSGHYPGLRYIEEIPSFLKIVVAITPGQFSQDFRRWRQTVPNLELDQVPANARRNLLNEITKTYGAVYGVKMTPTELQYCYEVLNREDLGQSTRRFIKGAVEFLDFRRFYPERRIEDLVNGSNVLSVK